MKSGRYFLKGSLEFQNSKIYLKYTSQKLQQICVFHRLQKMLKCAWQITWQIFKSFWQASHCCMPWEEQMYEILDLLYLYWYYIYFEVLSVKHLHLKQAIKWLISTLMTCSSDYFNIDDCLDMAWMISLTQLWTISKVCWQAGDN